jgi:hypothetical protein
MKLIILLTIQLTLIQAWTIDLSIQHGPKKSPARSYLAKIVSNMGGEAQLFCITENMNNLSCKQGKAIASSQGGYHILNLKCNDYKCELVIITEGAIFKVDAACDSNFLNLLDDRITASKPEFCEIQRRFELYLDGRIEYL